MVSFELDFFFIFTLSGLNISVANRISNQI